MEETSTTYMKKRLIGELIRGRACTTKLQNLVHRRVIDGGPASAEDLVSNITSSFSECLSMFSFPVSTSACLNKREMKLAPSTMKDPRGCYKRKTEDSRVEIANTYEDGFAWRKYGQKDILHAKFPRCYYRCTHKDEGCRASKRVQQLEDGSGLFRITYFGSHTCQNTNEKTNAFSELEDRNFFLINFEDSTIKHSPSCLSITNSHTSFKQQDINSNAHSSNYLLSGSQGTPSNYLCEDVHFQR